MTCRLGAFVTLAALIFAAQTQAQGILDEGLRDRLDNAPVALEMACGPLNEAICATVLPRLAARTARAGILLKPSSPTADPAAAICKGWVAVALLPRDAARQSADCTAGLEIVGRPLFPYYALLVTAAVRRPGLIVTDAVGNTMLANLSRTDPAWRQDIEITGQSLDQVLPRVTDGSAGAVFAVTRLDSALIDQVRRAIDAHGKALYAVADVRAGAAAMRLGDGEGHCLYRVAALDFGVAAPITTISVDAVMVLGRGFRDLHARGGPPVRDTLATAIEMEQEAFVTDTKSPPGWRPVGGSCH